MSSGNTLFILGIRKLGNLFCTGFGNFKTTGAATVAIKEPSAPLNKSLLFIMATHSGIEPD